MLSCSIKRKPKKISRSSFSCWELSRLNSFSRYSFTLFRKTKTPKTFQCVSLKFFSFLWVVRRRPRWKCWVALICIIVDLTKSPYCLVFTFEQTFADSGLVQCTCTIIIIHTVRLCKSKAIMTTYDEMIEMTKSWYELDLSCFCKYD